ncbi:MAG: GNAT family protein [Saprospiraceae bacterium]
MFQIKTKRLRLIPLNEDMLGMLRNSRPDLEKKLGLAPSDLQVSPEMQAEIAEALEFWQDFTHKHPDQYQWGTNWEIVHDQDNCAIGGIGLGGLPNKHGQVTVGYHIDPRRQRQGFAPEALAALRDWALQHPQCSKIMAFTPVENIPSQKVLSKCGFELLDEVEEGGMECYLWCYDGDTT